jgi:hypothetical protein
MRAARAVRCRGGVELRGIEGTGTKGSGTPASSGRLQFDDQPFVAT